MQLNNTEELLTLSEMHGYCNKKGEWLPMNEITSIKKIERYPRYAIHGVGENGDKMFFQITTQLFDQLIEKGIFKNNKEITNSDKTWEKK